MERSVVVLPAPLRPRSATTSLSPTCEREAMEDVAEPVVGVDAPDVEDHGAAMPPR